ncbi:hypothetical protein G2W53_043763 [Senna tora]|uniref:Uncharacterized protein n=1 Tax=Senna tora TaxID=362788 RepID=A0A834W0H0_9FABA|nr:hypothetical protein G2W53_043763 [Senna tora]
MEEREVVVVEFRTPQHPRFGTNNWGGASPLLARNIPKESLELKYSKLNSQRTRDEVFPTHHTSTNKSDTSGRSGILAKLLFFGKNKTSTTTTTTFGWNSKKRRWLPRLDPQNRWPQGWC